MADIPTVFTGQGDTVIIGDQVDISCNVSGSPSATSVTWTREVNGVTTTLNLATNSRYSGGTVTTPTLTIVNVQTSDEGKYRCSATNTVGTGQSSTTAFLNVVGGIMIHAQGRLFVNDFSIPNWYVASLKDSKACRVFLSLANSIILFCLK